MSFGEILEEIPKLTFAEREELIRHLVNADGERLSEADGALLDSRMEDYRRNPDAGIPIEQLTEQIARKLSTALAAKIGPAGPARY